MNLKQRLAQLKAATPAPGSAAAGVRSSVEEEHPATNGVAPAIAPLPAGAAAPAPLGLRLERHGSNRKMSAASVNDAALAELVGGALVAEGLISIDAVVELPAAHGRSELVAREEIPLPYVKSAGIAKADQLLFLDTETTGLAGGTGTLPFLVGLARFEGPALRVRQLFLTGFHGERALLAALRDWVRPQTRIVSFNGKAFDVPLLATRYRLARIEDPFSEPDHIDLLHPTRNAFARRWEDCRLQTAESLLLGFEREDDLPGHLIPYAWFNFVRSRVPGEVSRILAHNHWDVRSLAVLMVALARVYEDPSQARADVLGIARARCRRGDEREAVRILTSDADRLDQSGLLELATLHRRRGEWQRAVALWTELDTNGCLAATEALAKYFEHGRRDPGAALTYAQKLATGLPHDEAHRIRCMRLQRKLGQGCSGAATTEASTTMP